jgi:hypothetical protein
MTEVALQAGFRSLRRFNAVFVGATVADFFRRRVNCFTRGSLL